MSFILVLSLDIGVARMKIQSNPDISKSIGLLFTSSNYPKCKLICTSGNSDFKKSQQRHIMVWETNQNVLFIQIDASSFAEFEIFEFEISRVDCSYTNSSGGECEMRYPLQGLPLAGPAIGYISNSTCRFWRELWKPSNEIKVPLNEIRFCKGENCVCEHVH